jgi:hypothetical protein
MLILHPRHRGPTEPLRDVPPRRPGSVRRTSTIDTSWPGGFADSMTVRGHARDLRTVAAGAEVLDTVNLIASVAPDRTLSAIAGPDPRLADLVGTSTMRGFRSAVATTLPDLEQDGSPLRLLLDDLPAALLVSGVAVLAAGGHAGPMDDRFLDSQVNVCAGWADGSGLVEAARIHRRSPMPVSIPSPSLDDPDDPMAWHDAPLLPPIATRRRRLLDLSVDPDDPTRLCLRALFRDSHVGPDGVERSFHEYDVTASADRATRTFTTVEARPGVLPWHECPAALASAARLVGTTLAEARNQVRASFRGTSTCTHLNDVLAAMADAAVLSAKLRC